MRYAGDPTRLSGKSIGEIEAAQNTRLFVNSRMRFFLSMLSLLFAGVLAAQIFRVVMTTGHDGEPPTMRQPADNLQSRR